MLQSASQGNTAGARTAQAAVKWRRVQRGGFYYNFIASKSVGQRMDRQNPKAAAKPDGKPLKAAANPSKSKKQVRQSSSKNLKDAKSLGGKRAEEGRVRQETSPEGAVRNRELENDYGVNTYYAKYKVKTNKKKENQEHFESTDYGNFNLSRDQLRPEGKVEKGAHSDNDDSDYAASAFQKLRIPNNRGVINEQGKFVTVSKEKEQKNYSFHNQSASKHSFSLNFTSRDDSKPHKKHSKSRQKQSDKKDTQRKLKWRSTDKTHSRDHHAPSDKAKNTNHPTNNNPSDPLKTEKMTDSLQNTKLPSLNSQTNSPQAETEVFHRLNLAPNSNFVNEVQQEILKEMESSKSILRKQRSNETQVRERGRCLNMLGKICGAMAMKRETHALAIHYLDQYISQFPYQTMKIVALASLTLALKMDDAEMISKFCFQYLYNPERTVKKSSSHLKLKQKRDATKEDREMKSKLSTILTTKISDDKKPVKEDFNLDQVLDFQTHMMVKLGFRLVHKTVNYWVELFTAAWDNFVRETCPHYQDALSFRNEKHPRNLSYLLQLVELQQYSMAIYNQSKVALVLAALYLVGRMALQESRQETPWEELCRYYRASLGKTTNLIFCDGVGMNPIFGDFLALFGVSMAVIIECVQTLSRWLLGELRVGEWRRVEGLNREDRLNTYLYNEDLFKMAS